MPAFAARLLPPREWHRIPAFSQLNPDHSMVVVVEEDGPGGRILARWAALTVIHLEALHLEADAGAGVSRLLLETMARELSQTAARECLTQAESPAVEAMIESIGGRPVPGRTWVLPLDGGV